MAMEIERKYLITSMQGLDLPEGEAIEQGYLAFGDVTVRVRTKGRKAFLTLKGKGERGSSGEPIRRQEFEYEIPTEDARELLKLAQTKLVKTRYNLPGDLELDVFHGKHEGLILAEYESDDGAQASPPPGVEWREVTADERYSNAWMAKNGIPPEKP